jgi:hypothetical protein
LTLSEDQLVKFIDEYNITMELSEIRRLSGGIKACKESNQLIYKSQSALQIATCSPRNFNRRLSSEFLEESIVEIEFILRNPLVREQINEITNRNGRHFIIHDTKFSLNDLIELVEMFSGREQAFVNELSVDVLLAYFLACGYLSLDESYESDWCFYVKIPNEESNRILTANFNDEVIQKLQ